MSRINKTQKYAALWLNSQGQSAEDIANELELTDKQVSSIIQASTRSSAIKTKSEPVASSPSKNLMIRETVNKNKHVAIMTREASMVNDDAKKQQTTKREQPGIFKINKTDE
jgi:hypothetical protein